MNRTKTFRMVIGYAQGENIPDPLLNLKSNIPDCTRYNGMPWLWRAASIFTGWKQNKAFWQRKMILLR